VALQDVVCVEASAKYVASPVSSPGLTLSWDLKDPHASWRIDNAQIRVRFPFAITIEEATGDDAQNRVIADLNLVFQIVYSIDKLDKAHMSELPHYLGISGFMHLWPYVRAEVQCLTSKLRLPPLILPVAVSGHAARIVTMSPWGTIEEVGTAVTRSTKKAAKSKRARRPR
jgi:hypothetical protein